MENSIKNDRRALIAPCGMDCGVCDKYLAYSHQIPKKKGKICHCEGCRPLNKNCGFIKKKCITGKINEIDFCFECAEFPCYNLKKVAKGYKERYNFDFIENLYLIKTNGLDWFIDNQNNKNKCKICGDVICIHKLKCYSCDKEKLME